MKLDQYTTKLISEKKETNKYKNYPVITSRQGGSLKVNEVEVINLASNNYLGLASNPVVCEKAIEAIKNYGVGTASVRALVGTNSLHVLLESKLAKFKHVDDCMVVTSGYMANLAAIQTLLDKDDIIISDSLNHASIIDAIRMSGVKNKFIYNHSDIAHLKSLAPEISKFLSTPTESGKKRNAILVTDGVFSMDGDIALLPELVEFKNEYDIWLMVDDAHGEGVLGAKGEGISAHFDLHNEIDIEVGTLSKAFGVVGGFIAGSATLIDLMRQNARQFLFSNALSIPDTAALIAGIDLISTDDSAIKKLRENTKLLKTGLKDLGLDIGKSTTPITPIMLGDESLTKHFFEKLLQEGVLTTSIVFPMVALGTARLRLIPSSTHSEKQINDAVEIIGKVAHELGVI